MPKTVRRIARGYQGSITKTPPAGYLDILVRQSERNYRRDTPMATADFENHVKTAPKKAHDILTSYQNGAKATFNDPMIPDQGKLFKSGQLQQDAVQKLNALDETAGASADLARKAMRHEMDQARPKVDAATHERKTRQFQYLLDRGVSLESLISENAGDPESLRVLQEEAPVFQRGRYPEDSQAAEGIKALMEQAAYDTYGSDYQAKADELAEFDKGAYRVQVALNQATRVARDGDLRADASIPAFQQDRMIEA